MPSISHGDTLLITAQLEVVELVEVQNVASMQFFEMSTCHPGRIGQDELFWSALHPVNDSSMYRLVDY